MICRFAPMIMKNKGIDRVIRSVLSWEACMLAAAEVDTEALMAALAERATAKAEDIMRNAVVGSQSGL